MKRDRLKKLAADERFIAGIYNYCDRWCERCPQTSHCLNFSVSEEEFPDPEARDIRNEAFWEKLSETLEEALELVKETAREWEIELETLDSAEDTETAKAKEAAVENHLLCRAARKYSEWVEEWFKGRETPFLLERVAAAKQGIDLDEAIEVIRWYQSFICAKVMRAVRGEIEDDEERSEGALDDSDGSAKIGLIAIDRSVSAWTVIPHFFADCTGEVGEIITFLDSLRQAVEKAFPRARSFIRPGFDTLSG